MKKFLSGKIYVDTLSNGTEKAFHVEIDDGRWSSERNAHFWIPKSVCEISEPNKVGWCDILVPVWIFTKFRIDWNRVREINWVAPGVVIK